MKHQRAFTLIELIAVIVILGIVLTIAVPTVTNIINTSYIKAYELDEKALKSAAKDYMLQNSLSLNNDENTTITIGQMISKGIMDKVLDPKTKEECDGYVIVFKLEDKYSYHSFLKCGGNYETPNYGVTDVTPPVITIIGDNPLTIHIGDTYIDAGATAIDDVDGNVTSRMTTTSNINNNILGAYLVTYTVSDSVGNRTAVQRTVNVL